MPTHSSDLQKANLKFRFLESRRATGLQSSHNGYSTYMRVTWWLSSLFLSSCLYHASNGGSLISPLLVVALCCRGGTRVIKRKGEEGQQKVGAISYAVDMVALEAAAEFVVSRLQKEGTSTLRFYCAVFIFNLG
ncbi:hypothetical protein SESBI_29797 [Sesbania bispinosa]|nr:hypothetical protein SESBI_29797 [Sesbania bispinosa]